MHRRSSLSLAAVSAFLLLSSVARAQEPDSKAQEAAAELYKQASLEMEAGDYARACPRLEAARKMLPDHVRTGMTLALCYEQSGQPGSAWAELLRVKPLAESQGKADKTLEIQNRLTELEPRVPKLTVEVPEGLSVLPGLAITRNGVPIAASKWGKAEPVDPGVYEIEATALGKEAWATKVEVKAEGKVISVKIEPPWVEEKKEPVAVVAPPPPPPPPPFQKRNGLIATGAFVAVAGLGLGLGSTLISNGKSSDAQAAWEGLNKQNDPGACRNQANATSCAELRSAYDSKELFRGVAIGGYVAGGAFALGTLVYVLLPTRVLPRALLREGEPEVNGVRASVSVTPDGGGAVLRGTF